MGSALGSSSGGRKVSVVSESPLVAPAATTAKSRSDLSLGIAAATLAVTAWGSSGIIVRFIDMGALALIAYRFVLYAVVMATALAVRRTPVTRAGMRHSLWGGLSLGTVVGLFITAVRLTTIANVTIISALQLVVVAVVSALLFGERMSRRDIAYAALAMLGVAVVALGSSGSENWSLDGDLAAVGGLFGWSFYFFATRRAQTKVSTQEYTVCVAIYVGLISLPLAALFGQDLSWPSGEDWMWLVALAFGLGILGHNAMKLVAAARAPLAGVDTVAVSRRWWRRRSPGWCSTRPSRRCRCSPWRWSLRLWR